MRRVAVLVVASFAMGACSSASKGDGVDALKRRLEEMAQAQSEAKNRLEELNNRVFILEDRVDTSRVALESSGKAPRLPVIRLRPAQTDLPEEQAPVAEEAVAEEAVAEEAVAEDDRPLPRSVVEDKEVHYSGDARAQSGPRPVLRLNGSPTRRRLGVAAALPGPNPSDVQEKLPVVALPSRRVARRAAAGTAVVRHEYQTALTMYRSGKHSAAADAFRGFLKRYSKHEYADNALYWLGECFYDTKSYRLALTMFRRVVEEYPTGNKSPDALLKMGYSYLKLKENQNARTVLAQLVESFPKSQVARLASETLVTIQ